MDNKNVFGNIAANNIDPGDLSVAHVVPLVNPRKKLEFFTLSLKLISKGSKDIEKD